MNRWAVIGITAIIAVLVFGTVYVFYQHAAIAAFGSFCSLLAWPIAKRYVEKRERKELILQFRQWLYALSSALAAGKSVENALIAAENDIRTYFPSKRQQLLREISLMNGQVLNGQSTESALQALSSRIQQEDVANFAEVFTICKRTGGDLVEVIRRTAHLMAEKMEVEQDIQVMTAQKRFEARVMAVVPIVLIALLVYSSPDYMAPLYTGPGRVIMSIALIGFILCYWWMNIITNLKV